MRTLLGVAALALAAACSPPADQTQTADTATVETPAPMAPAPTVVISETDARSRIEGAGYTNVTSLMQNPDGTWNATATKDGATTAVVVNDSGVSVATTTTP